VSDEDVEELLKGTGGPPAWFEVAELLDRIRMEAAVEPDDLWVRTHVAVAAAAVRKANLVPDPTAGRPSRPLRLGAVAATTTTLIATTMGLAAADTLPEPLQSVASHVASLVGMSMPDGHDRDPAVVVPVPMAPPEPGDLPASPSTTHGEPSSRDRQAAPGPDPTGPTPPPGEGGGDARGPDRFGRRPTGGDGRSGWTPGWGLDGDRFERRNIPSSSSPPTGDTTYGSRRPDVPWAPSGAGGNHPSSGGDRDDLIERWNDDRLRPYADLQPGPDQALIPPSTSRDDVFIASLPPMLPSQPRWRPPVPPTTPTTTHSTAAPQPEVTAPTSTVTPGAPPLPRRPRSGTWPGQPSSGSGGEAPPLTDTSRP
jgi:hypothetical protein